MFYVNIFRAILLVGLFSLVVLQPTSAIDLRYHWASSILALGAVSLVVWPLKPQLQRAMLAIGFLLLVLILLVSTWQSGVSTWNFIAGVLPTSDAGGYYFDAQRILAGNSISDFSSRRPLFAAFLAGVLAIAGNDLQVALIYISIFQGASFAICLGLFPKSIPRIVVMVFVITVFLYYRRFVGTTLTEQLGLAYGMIAFGLLLRGYLQNSESTIAVGVFVLALALNARAGPFLVLPLLLLLAARFDFSGANLLSWGRLIRLMIVVVLAFLMNQLLLTLLHGERAASFSNFSHVLYGLVFGGDWTLALVQHPEIASMKPNEQSALIMKYALQQIAEQPTSLVIGAIKAWVVFIPTAYIFAASSHPNAPALIPHFILSVLALAGIVWLMRNHRLPLSNLLSVALVGIFLSVPFVPPWDSDQMRAYAAVLPFIAFLPALGVISLWSIPLKDQSRSCLNEERNLKWWSFISLVLIGVASIGLPIWAYGQYPVGNFDNVSSKCNKDSSLIHAEILPGTMRDVLDNENLPSIKTVGKRFLVDPVGSLYEIPQLLVTGSLTKDVLEKNLFTEFAPDYVRSFIHAVHGGDSFAYARVNESSSEISSLKLVFFSREAGKFAFKSNVFCATELVKLNALRLDINTAP